MSKKPFCFQTLCMFHTHLKEIPAFKQGSNFKLQNDPFGTYGVPKQPAGQAPVLGFPDRVSCLVIYSEIPIFIDTPFSRTCL